MKYTTTIRIRAGDFCYPWVSRPIVEAETVEEAKIKAVERFKEVERCDLEIIEVRVSEYKEGDEHRLCIDTEQWELEEYNKNALGKIARALERIGNKDFSIRSEPTPIVQNSGITPFLIFSSVCSLLTIVVLVVLKLLFR